MAASSSSSTSLSVEEKARMDRQLHAFGEAMILRMKGARVLLSGLGGLGVEIAKNVALAGCKTLVLHDTVNASLLDLSTQFYLSPENIGQNRAAVSGPQVAELNPFTPVVINTDDIWAKSDEELSSFLKDFACVVLTESPHSTQVRVNGLCHQLNIPFIAADVRGLFCSAFVDAGQHHEVWDQDGEAPLEVLIGNISKGSEAVVECLTGHKCPFVEGDQVSFREVQGMESLNVGSYTVKTVEWHKERNHGSFVLDLNTASFPEFIPGSGRAIQQKVHKKISHDSLASVIANPPADKLLLSDFAKFDAPPQIHLAFLALNEFWSAKGSLPRPWSAEDAEAMLELAKSINAKSQLVGDVSEITVKALAHTAQGSLCPLTGFLGGFISQEVLKLISGKFLPLNQFFYLDVIELYPKDGPSYTPGTGKNEAQRITLGNALCEKLARARIFTVGAGAIGCELVKNYAMMNVATEEPGEVIITDDDRIELSNLNRQFLFREGDLQKPKSTTAAGVARRMNPALRITAQEKRVEKKSEDVFSNKFYSTLDAVINALDNVAARQYVDARCVENQKGLIDSGTLSSKGHVQAIVPFKTESYGSQSDPASQDVPFCTIKSFPHEISHCIQWARDLGFEVQFVTRPNRWNKLFGLPDPIAALTAPDGAALRPDIIAKMLKNKPTSFDDCVRLARQKWEKTYHHAPSDLLHAFPLGTKTSDGTLFWTSPKRPPHPLTWDSSDPMNIGFVTAYANMLAFMYKIPQCRDTDHIAAVANATPVPAWVPKSKNIETDETKKAPQEESKNKLDPDSVRGYIQQIRAALAAGPIAQLEVAEFEKDDDSNFHIDCIHATSNLRARVYSIDEISRMDTKRIAGRILPALATTTSCVSGWAMVQFLTLLADGPIESYKNVFLNLALPVFQFSEPGATKRIGKPGSFYDTIWDQWAVHDPSMTIRAFLAYVKDKYAFDTSAIIQDGSLTVYLGFMHSNRLDKKLLDCLPEPPNPDADYILLTLVPQEEEPEDDEDEDEDEEKEQEGALLRFYLK